jgi:two-component system cell cycle sensor histidine kinase/response regulator CckA
MGRATIPFTQALFRCQLGNTLMTDAHANSLHDEVTRLRACVKELEAELARLRAPVAEESAGRTGERPLIEDLPAAAWQRLPGEFRLRYVAPRAGALLGFAVADWYVPGFLESRLHPEDRERVLAFFREETLREGESALAYRLFAADGRVVPVLDLVRVTALVCGLLVDRSEWKRQEDGQREAWKREVLGVLAGGLAHEFNNLLTSILGYSSLAERDLPPGAAGRGYLQEVSRAGNRAAELTRQLLAYAGQVRLVPAPLDLAGLLWEMKPLLEAASGPARLRLEIPESPLRISADAVLVRQVIVELVRNAFESLVEQSGTITVRATVLRLEADDLPAGKYACLTVEDTGTGMSESTLERVFDPFFTTRFPGRGMGLAAAQGIVRAHGGRLRATSAPNQGSSFAVLFPALPEAGQPA